MQLLHEKAEKNLMGAPEETLRLGKSQGGTQYFHCCEDTRPSGKYIPKGDDEIEQVFLREQSILTLHFCQKTGEEIYWEHEGMMDNPEYAKSAVKKIEAYEKNGIFLGENLILTFETSTQILEKRTLEALVRRHLL